jgi:L-aminopeptidase/D-esterase-like protein
MEEVHAVLLSGGSAFGLAAADGVMRFLEERGTGYRTPWGIVPIVPAAVVFDLNVGSASVRPTADSGYSAARAASGTGIEEGRVGAGAGASVG